ncbi:hypothetical protein HWC09_gp089 [Lactobacillus phage 3-521]|uniref:Uncharacterized protein n=1 Tax=Lactobacillus phage 3-521 TaxID=2510943 RepID=A0A4Y5FFG7_9CAUD|nr:hypothetical protein HWC09_gp089 [Lactobacillus phage 3-521]QBJ03630.1 hypothetical protein UCC3521_0092 [Lactobacillus phage 3-521]
MSTQNKMSKEELLNAYREYIKVPNADKSLKDKAIKDLDKRVSLKEIMELNEILTYPLVKQYNKVAEDDEIMQVLLNKLGATEEQWKEAEEEVKNSRKALMEKAKKELKEKLGELDKDEDSDETSLSGMSKKDSE